MEEFSVALSFEDLSRAPTINRWPSLYHFSWLPLFPARGALAARTRSDWHGAIEEPHRAAQAGSRHANLCRQRVTRKKDPKRHRLTSRVGPRMSREPLVFILSFREEVCRLQGGLCRGPPAPVPFDTLPARVFDTERRNWPGAVFVFVRCRNWPLTGRTRAIRLATD